MNIEECLCVRGFIFLLRQRIVSDHGYIKQQSSFFIETLNGEKKCIAFDEEFKTKVHFVIEPYSPDFHWFSISRLKLLNAVLN